MNLLGKCLIYFIIYLVNVLSTVVYFKYFNMVFSLLNLSLLENWLSKPFKNNLSLENFKLL